MAWAPPRAPPRRAVFRSYSSSVRPRSRLRSPGAGAWSLDHTRVGLPAAHGVDREIPALARRPSRGRVFLVGGLLHGFGKIASLDLPTPRLVVVGLGSVTAAAVGGVFFAGKLGGASSPLDDVDGVEREPALPAVGDAPARLGTRTGSIPSGHAAAPSPPRTSPAARTRRPTRGRLRTRGPAGR
jgi:hypothetical protein